MHEPILMSVLVQTRDDRIEIERRSKILITSHVVTLDKPYRVLFTEQRHRVDAWEKEGMEYVLGYYPYENSQFRKLDDDKGNWTNPQPAVVYYVYEMTLTFSNNHPDITYQFFNKKDAMDVFEGIMSSLNPGL